MNKIEKQKVFLLNLYKYFGQRNLGLQPHTYIFDHPIYSEITNIFLTCLKSHFKYKIYMVKVLSMFNCTIFKNIF